MSTVEDIQKNLVEKIASMQFEFEEQKKGFKAEIAKLESIIKAKNEELDNLKIGSTWEMAENTDQILKDQLDATRQMNAAFQADIQAKSKEIANFRKEVTQLRNENFLLKQDSKKLSDEIEKLKKENKDFEDLNTKYEQ